MYIAPDDFIRKSDLKPMDRGDSIDFKSAAKLYSEFVVALTS